MTWLQEQKQKLRHCKLTIAVGHHPYHNFKTKRGPAKGPIKKFLETYVLGNFDYYIAGHNHFMNFDGIDKGTIQYTTGAGGNVSKEDLPGYLTMIIEHTNGGLKVLTSIKEITREGKTIQQDRLNTF